MAATTVTETFVPAASSNIGQFTYDPEAEVLTVDFVNGDQYCYYNVPQSVYSSWTANGGSGGFFNRHIKGRYSYDKQ